MDVPTTNVTGLIEADRYDWPKLAAALAERIPMDTLHPDVVAELRWTGEKVGIACSGGADSLALLLLLFAHFPERRSRFSVLHFDHRIRGAESADDARFVAAVAASLGLTHESGMWEESNPDATEDEARVARMGFLHEKTRVIAFGHNQSDVAETILLRLGRGSSLDGLAGPRPVQRFRQKPGIVHLRPLINISGPDIRNSLKACNIPWREDSTNAGPQYTRNRLRHEVLPLLENILGRNWTAGAARSRERIEEVDNDLNRVSDEILHASHENTGELHVSVLANTSPAIARRLVERWLENNRLRETTPVSAIDRLIDAAPSGNFPRNLNLPGAEILGEFIHAKKDRTPPRCDWAPITVPDDCEIFFPNGAALKVRPVLINEGEVAGTIHRLKELGSTTDVIISAPDTTAFNIRRRSEGDAYRPLGSPGRDKLKEMQINRKIPSRERGTLPVVLADEHIVWSPYLPPADEFKLTQTTTHAVRLTYRNISPASDSYKRNADE